MILANISTPLLGMVDTAVVGHLDSPHYLGAVAVGTLIFSFLFWGFGFLRMATTGLSAQAIGSDDNSKMFGILTQSLLLALVVSMLILLLQTPIHQLAFYLIESSDLVTHYARTYFEIRIWSTPAILINYVILGWLIGKQETKLALLLVLVVNITNIVLDVLLVAILGMTVDGVAIASVFAEYAGLLIAILILKHQGVSLSIFKNIRSDNRGPSSISWLKLHGNIFIRTMCLIFTFAFFTAQGAKQGDIILAVNAVLLNFITFMAFVLDGFANATEVISGKAMGARDKDQLKQGLILSGFWAISVAIGFSISYLFFGQYIVNMLTSIPKVAETANNYLPWLVITPLIAVWTYVFDGLFIGTTRSTEMRNSMLFATLCCFFPAWYFLQPLANHGLWLALLIFLAARGLIQTAYLAKILQLK